MLNYNPEGKDLLESFGITKERGDELAEKMTEIAKEVFIKAKNGGISYSYIIEKASVLPKTPEEIFMVGMYSMQINHDVRSYCRLKIKKKN